MIAAGESITAVVSLPQTLSNKVRAATEADLPVLVRMGEQFAAELYAGFLRVQAASLTALGTWLLSSEQGTILVSERDGEIVGMIGLAVHPHLMTGELVCGELFWWVTPEARGRVGLTLLRAAEAWAVSHGAVFMQMVAPTADVERLYTHRGYQRMEVAYTRRLGA